MKALTLLSLLYIPVVLAAPATDTQIVFGETAALVDTLREGLVYSEEIGPFTEHNTENFSHEDKAETWFERDREFVKQNGLVCTSFHLSSVVVCRPLIVRFCDVKTSWSGTRRCLNTSSGQQSPDFATHLSSSILVTLTSLTESTCSSG